MPKYSMVITTYNHCEDLLKPCIQNIMANTDLDDFEIIVSANGCKDNTREYVESLGPKFKLVWHDEAIGYTCAANRGIEATTGDFVILMNDDVEVRPQERNYWINELQKPFLENPKMGITGLLELPDIYVREPCLIFWCAMIKREVIDTIGLYDEFYNPGSGEDIDYNIRTRAAGFETKCVAQWDYNGWIWVGYFPVWHNHNSTFKHDPNYRNVVFKRNGLHNCKKYNKNIKVSFGPEGRDGYITLDPNDYRAELMMEFNDLAFDDDTVAEIVVGTEQFYSLNPYHMTDILAEWRRALRPGGKLILDVLDFSELSRMFVNADKDAKRELLKVMYGTTRANFVDKPYLYGWWPDAIRDHLNNAGFQGIQITSRGTNMYIEVTK